MPFPTSTADPSQPVRLTGNVPFVGGGSFATALTNTFGLTSDGIIGLNSISVPGFATVGASSGKVPYTQNWNFSLSFQLMKNTAMFGAMLFIMANGSGAGSLDGGGVHTFEPSRIAQHQIGDQRQDDAQKDRDGHFRQQHPERLRGQLDAAFETDGQKKEHAQKFVDRRRKAQIRAQQASG